jgi:hypothetical protein
MKFTVELDEFWLSEDRDLEPELKKYVVKDVVRQVNDSLKDQIENSITVAVKEQIVALMDGRIAALVEEVIKTEKLKNGSQKDGISIVEYIKQYFQNNNSYRSADEVIKKEATKFGNDMKARYDLLFASQLVAKLHESGMIKEDVIKLLLQPSQS